MKLSTQFGKLIKFFSKPKSWCRNSFAKDSKNMPVDWTDKNAVSFCLAGARLKLNLESEIAIHITKKANRCISYYNDHIVKDKRQLLRHLTKWRKELLSEGR